MDPALPTEPATISPAAVTTDAASTAGGPAGAGPAAAGSAAAVPAAAAAPADPAAPNGTGVPGVVLAAYRNAEHLMAVQAPSCRVPWTLLAGIGRVESGHAAGGRVDAAGTTRGPILGPRLDGSPGMALIRDTDGGALDGDPTYDRAVGPMQFIPSTWRVYALDGNGDGIASPHNVYDAALTAGRFPLRGRR